MAEGAQIEMEMTVEMGRGYEAVERRGELQTIIGVIPIDSLFSPVRKVNYAVTNSRVGRRTDFQKLTLEIWTDGTILPEDAIAYAAKIVKNQLTIFINFDEAEIDEVPESEEKQEIRGTEEILFNTIEEMDLSARSLNCLRKANIEYAGDLVQRSEEDLLNLENFGKRSLVEIRERIEEMGLSLGIAIDKEVFDAEKEKRGERSAAQYLAPPKLEMRI